MMRPVTLFVAFALPLAAAGAAPMLPPGANANQRLAEAQKEASAATRRYEALQSQVAKAGDEIARARAEQDAAAAAMLQSESLIAEAEAEVRLADAQAAALKRQLDGRRAPVAALLAGLLTVGRQPPILALADGTSSEELVRLKALIDTVGPEIERRTAALSADVARQNALAATAQKARDRIADNRVELAQRQQRFAALEADAAARSAALTAKTLGAGDRLLAGRENLIEAQRDAGSSTRALAEARAIAALGMSPARPMPGDAPLPASDFAYRLPVDARIADGVGSISEAGIVARGMRFETGRGSPVVAPADGTILFAGPFRRQDGVVIIDHGNGRLSLLLGVATTLGKGATVSLGQRLGIATGPVTVEFRDKGRLISPAFIAASSPPLSNAAQTR